jgi:hypothetical protein
MLAMELTFAEGLTRRRVGAAVGLPTTTVLDYVALAPIDRAFRRAASGQLSASSTSQL